MLRLLRSGQDLKNYIVDCTQDSRLADMTTRLWDISVKMN